MRSIAIVKPAQNESLAGLAVISLVYITPVLRSLHWLPVRQRIVYKLATLILMGRAPSYLAENCHQAGTRRPGTRSADSSMLDVPRTRIALGDRSFAVSGPRIWNSLPASIRDSTLLAGTFPTLLKTYLFVQGRGAAAQKCTL